MWLLVNIIRQWSNGVLRASCWLWPSTMPSSFFCLLLAYLLIYLFFLNEFFSSSGTMLSQWAFLSPPPMPSPHPPSWPCIGSAHVQYVSMWIFVKPLSKSGVGNSCFQVADNKLSLLLVLTGRERPRSGLKRLHFKENLPCLPRLFRELLTMVGWHHL